MHDEIVEFSKLGVVLGALAYLVLIAIVWLVFI